MLWEGKRYSSCDSVEEGYKKEFLFFYKEYKKLIFSSKVNSTKSRKNEVNVCVDKVNIIYIFYFDENHDQLGP